MVAGVEEQCVKPRLVEVGSQGEHESGVATPAVENDHGGSRFDGWDVPPVEPFPRDALQPDLFLGKSQVGWRLVCGALRRCKGAKQELLGAGEEAGDDQGR